MWSAVIQGWNCLSSPWIQDFLKGWPKKKILLTCNAYDFYKAFFYHALMLNIGEKRLYRIVKACPTNLHCLSFIHAEYSLLISFRSVCYFDLSTPKMCHLKFCWYFCLLTWSFRWQFWIIFSVTSDRRKKLDLSLHLEHSLYGSWGFQIIQCIFISAFLIAHYKEMMDKLLKSVIN